MTDPCIVIPAELVWAVTHLKYKPGWKFGLRSGQTWSSYSLWDGPPEGNVSTAAALPVVLFPAYLVIEARVMDSGNHNWPVNVQHTFTVPHPGMRMEWDEWLLHCILEVEHHEAMEYFEVGRVKTFYPEHGSNANLYGLKRKKPMPYPEGTHA